jgi:hypothetical protein
MVARAFISLIAVTALVAPLGAFRPASPALIETHVSAPHSAASAPKNTADVLVEWVIRSRDIVACETVTPDLRRAQQQYRGRVRIVAYAVATDTALVRSFLRRERLFAVELRPVTEREFQRDFANRFERPLRTPSLIVVVRGAEMEAFDAGVRLASGRRSVEEFGRYLNVVLGSAEPERHTRGPSITNRPGGE